MSINCDKVFLLLLFILISAIDYSKNMIVNIVFYKNVLFILTEVE